MICGVGSQNSLYLPSDLNLKNGKIFWWFTLLRRFVTLNLVELQKTVWSSDSANLRLYFLKADYISHIRKCVQFFSSFKYLKLFYVPTKQKIWSISIPVTNKLTNCTIATYHKRAPWKVQRVPFVPETTRTVIEKEMILKRILVLECI